MTAAEILLAHCLKLGLLTILVGLFVRHRAHLCWSFVVYLAWGFIGNSLITFWPDQFYRQWFYMLMQASQDVLKLAIAAELAYRTFKAFPGAAARVRILLAPLFFVPVLFLSKVPPGATLEDMMRLYQPQVLTGVIWLMTAITLLIAWYRVPIHPMNRAILIGFAAYLLTFTTLLNILRDFGFENLMRFIGMADGYAYLLLLGGWAYAAWVPARRPVVSLDVLRRLQLEPV
ncbi:MAG: hypothetical protein DMF78_10635 [Acidobacteria bacterium]|nr:MAG: hypothetical protein DMF78_10635 [Acidobacteriota bacterium]